MPRGSKTLRDVTTYVNVARAGDHSVERLAHAVENLLAHIVAGRGDIRLPGGRLTQTQRLALRLIADNGPLRPRELAEPMHTTPATVSRTIAALKEARMVTVTPDRTDGRGLVVKVTAKGLRVTQQRHRELVDTLGSAFADIPHQDRQRLVVLLEKLEHVV
jgi:DNA-binding MarR family transcriptional regulator